MTDTPSDLPPETRVGRVALRVADLDRLTAFYRTVVGLDVLTRHDDRATLGAGDAPLLELVAAPDDSPRGDDEAGLFHTAFRVPSRAALAAALARVRDEWRLDGASDHEVSEALYLTDPEGNGIEVYRDRPRTEWPHAPDGSVRMSTLPLDLEALSAAADTPAAVVPAGTDVGHVHLEVTSLASARAFYVDALGLRVRQRYGDEALFVAAGDYHHHIGLNTWNGRSVPRTGRGLDWFELLVPPATLDAVERRLAADDVAVDPVDGGLDVRAPDGVGLKLRTP
ncbi:VOC family protein [Halomarina ordinaria]|uniref:VOC family protein n=1 Tax=Halomarina ordinaria TaxID=3033939 RepID=A0ABD5UFP4_9EURY|nr:VOC family protein [Halomarina sp. PSRA2]